MPFGYTHARVFRGQIYFNSNSVRFAEKITSRRTTNNDVVHTESKNGMDKKIPDPISETKIPSDTNWH